MLSESEKNFSPLFAAQAYESNGLLAKLIDQPADDALSKGFELQGISRDSVSWYEDQLDRLEWEEAASTALRWQRLFGGALVVMLANDGHGLEDPLYLERVRGVDGLVIYDCTTVRPNLDIAGQAQSFSVHSDRGSFTVHETRCLLFRSDPLPNLSKDPEADYWGIPLYIRMERALQEVITAHGWPSRMLSWAGQPVYRMKDLSAFLASSEGERKVTDHLRAFELMRSVYNTLAIDAGEEILFSPIPENIAGAVALVNASWAALSAVTGMPQSILTGQPVPDSPGEVKGLQKGYDQQARQEYASCILDIQQHALQPPLLRLLEVLGRAGVDCGRLDQVEQVTVKWRPFYVASPMEAADNALKKAQAQLTRAQTLAQQLKAGIITAQEALRIIKKK